MTGLRHTRRRLLNWLWRAYRRIGMHAAPPGTLLFFIHSRARALLFRRLRPYVSGSLYARGRFGGTPYYDIARLRSVRQVDGLALIFFCGLGDYLLATPAIEALRIAHPGLPIYAYASETTDAVSSPLVASLLRGNRYIDAVFTYRGRMRENWISYDFRDCLKDIPRNFLILPVVYGVEPEIVHRVTSLFEAFKLPVTLPVPLPVLESSALSAQGEAVAAEIRDCLCRTKTRKAVCCHFGTRSSGYLYPERDALITQLRRAGFAVVSFSPTDLQDPGLVAVDVARITPADTIELLRMLKRDTQGLYVLSVNSLFWPISAGLDVPNLGLHIFHDASVHQYIYPNLFLVTQHIYPRVSPSRVFLAPDGSFAERSTDNGLELTDFDATFVLDCFLRMIDIAGPATSDRAISDRARGAH